MCECLCVCVCVCVCVCMCVYCFIITIFHIYETVFVGQMFKNINISQPLPIKVSLIKQDEHLFVALMCDVGGKLWNSFAGI
jgi:type IV secretory pathway VirB6-like protein